MPGRTRPTSCPSFCSTAAARRIHDALILAATLSANYGIYGPAFERFVHVAREHGSEEYLDSEKYEVALAAGDDDLTELIGSSIASAARTSRCSRMRR
jgi:hypothetical protein